jgi:cytochrome c551/c552
MKNIIKTGIIFTAIIGLACLFTNATTVGDNLPTEDDYYKIIKLPIPEGIVMEVGGIANLPNGEIAVCTRRGDVWIVENPSADVPTYRKFATGLHEPLGLTYKDGNLYCAQRGELTRLVDKNGDGKADRYETVCAWPISGHYHEYSFGPKIAPDGTFWVTANVGFGSSDWWAGKSLVPWRGWTMQISEDGKMTPWSAGMRSPCGVGTVNGDFFYSDNQGDWMGSGFIMHVEKGDFAGHPASLEWANRPESPVKMRKEMVYAKVNPRDNPKLKPEYIKDEPMTTIYEFGKNNPNMGVKPPSVWLPHGVLGVSSSEIITDETNGNFGPFAGQVFVGDQGMSKIARVFLEKVNGQYQGASFDFRNSFRSGVLRMSFGSDNAMYVGGTNRGWGSSGKEPYGLERLMWTGKTPFEMKAMRAMPDGFEIEFTQAVNKATAENVENYTATSFNYKYHPVYGSPLVNFQENAVRGAKSSADGLKVRIVVDGLREGYIHDIKPEGVRSEKGNLPLLHPQGFYTLNNIPKGAKADIKLVAAKVKNVEMEDAGSKVNTPDNQTKEAAPSISATVTPDNPKVIARNEATEGSKVVEKTKEKVKEAAKKPTPVPTPKPKVETPKPVAATPTPAATAVLTDKEAMVLLNKYTCSACHKANERTVGPSFSAIAKRNYSVSKIVQLVYEPKPQNWPEFSTPMAPMPHVPKKDVEKIAAWIISMKK